MPGLLRGIARTAVVAGTATAVSNRVSRRQAGRWARQEQAVAESPPPQQVPDQGSGDGGGGMADTLAQLKQLGELKQQGILTEEEFEAQKAHILGS
ncbi:SHOCT domain-containing protein [Pseudonocardia bannensis]|uniref:SHOCT domain-containing protein n=1 Tax=Pseudonocardia bannensis TaxID=630973 RepID=A0A848DH85_9PSEU|nr:SHOCT domain-containing protein [Pseudonocardia bannensis]NMH92040.1 SHOCT domain-containing protein [Pseudonocardia bannensis]